MDYVANIEHWIFDALSKKNNVFNNLPPCPFAKQAWVENKVYLKHEQDPNIAEDQELLKSYEVIIYVYDPTKIDSDTLSNLAKALSNQEIVALEDHPSHIEEIQGISLNNGEYALILVQLRSKLEQARKALEATGYYKNWPTDYLNEVLSQ